MKSIRQGLLKLRGTPAWDGLIRLSGLIAVAGLPLVLWVPAAGGLVFFVLASVWVHGPASPFLPASYEPILFIFGRAGYSPILLALIGTAANLMAEYLNYQLFRELLARRALERFTQHPRLLKLVALFNRRPFVTTWFISWSPIPDWTIRVLAPLGKYPVWPWLAAMGLGRFPRFWLLASLGTVFDLDVRALGWLLAIPATAVIVGLLRTLHHRRRRPVLELPVATTPNPTSSSNGGIPDVAPLALAHVRR